jgi:hypothetical protein
MLFKNGKVLRECPIPIWLFTFSFSLSIFVAHCFGSGMSFIFCLCCLLEIGWVKVSSRGGNTMKTKAWGDGKASTSRTHKFSTRVERDAWEVKQCFE